MKTTSHEQADRHARLIRYVEIHGLLAWTAADGSDLLVCESPALPPDAVDRCTIPATLASVREWLGY